MPLRENRRSAKNAQQYETAAEQQQQGGRGRAGAGAAARSWLTGAFFFFPVRLSLLLRLLHGHAAVLAKRQKRAAA
jgi:hypothetical protein